MLTGGDFRCIHLLHMLRWGEGGGTNAEKRQSQREKEGSTVIHPSMSGKHEKQFRVPLSSMRVTTYCTLHIHVLRGAEGSTLASRYMLVHISSSQLLNIQIDAQCLGRRAIRSINLGVLCPASEREEHLQQLPPQRQFLNLIWFQNTFKTCSEF